MISNGEHSSLLQTGLPSASVISQASSVFLPFCPRFLCSKLPNKALSSFHTTDHSGLIHRIQNGKRKLRNTSELEHE